MWKVDAEKYKIGKSMKPSSEKLSRFKDWTKDYLKNSSVAGFAYYVSQGERVKERLYWIVVHIICVILLISMIVIVTFEYARSPTVTTPEMADYPIQKILHPAIAICHINKLNHSVAGEVAEEILLYDYVGNISRAELINMLKYLGHLYLFELDDSERETIDLLHKLLVRRYGDYVLHLTRKLAPDIDCQFMLQYCSWSGEEQICNNMFLERLTGDGNCCLFNYARKNDAFGKKTTYSEHFAFSKPLYPQSIGSRFGLTVLIRSDVDTHYYKLLSTRGYKILIFPPFDFPDATSGGLREILVAPRTENWLSLDAVSFYSVPEVSRLGTTERGCLFKHELSRIFDGYYSYSDCIMYCRIADIRNLCKCSPFFYPNDETTRLCNLQDLPCLRKHKARWMKVSPRTEQKMVKFPLDQLSDALNCSECFPACADVLYKVSVSSAPLSVKTVRMGKGTYVLHDQSIIHVYFKHIGTVRLKQDVLYHWYDLMSNYGGICGLFLGVSVISVAEFIYFCTVRLYVKKKKKKKKFHKAKILRLAIAEAVVEPNFPSLYWNEFFHRREKK